jgi:hypothetical protein
MNVGWLYIYGGKAKAFLLLVLIDHNHVYASHHNSYPHPFGIHTRDTIRLEAVFGSPFNGVHIRQSIALVQVAMGVHWRISLYLR